MRFSLISKWAAASVVVFAALAFSVPASAGPNLVNGNGGSGVPGGQTHSVPQAQTPAVSRNPYQLTVESRASLVPAGQTKGHPFVTQRRALHPNFSVESVLHVFTGLDGQNPQGWNGQLLNGVLFGTAFSDSASGTGVDWAFNTKTSAYSVVHHFKGSDGSNPVNIDWIGVGVTQNGGAYGKGAVYALDIHGNVRTLHSFNGADGAQPIGNPMVFIDGCVYGTTSTGTASNNGDGTIYQICGSHFRTLHNFNLAVEGGDSTAGLSIAINGLSLSPNLFGTTFSGGPNGAGTLYAVSPSTGAVQPLYAFGPNPVTQAPNPAGDNPMAEVITDFNGNLYGTTNAGTANALGAVFRFSLTTNTMTTLVTFGGSGEGNSLAPLAFDAYGNLYGTTSIGGNGGPGGTAFVVTASGVYLQLHAFGNGNDGSSPAGPVLVGVDGNLYGTTQHGGSNTTDFGTIWRMQ